jgi:small-conductance mechanosensitive channel
LRRILTKKSEDPLLTKFILRVVKYLFFLITLLLMLNTLGLGGIAAAVWGTAGVGAFIIGFAFKDIFEHFLAGFLLAFNRPFRIGDLVELDGNKGIVVALSIRNTHIKTFDGQDVYIPNGNIIKNALRNYTIDGFLRQDFVVGLEYGSDVHRAIAIILKELKGINGILQDDKSPSVTIDSLGASSLKLIVFYWLNTFDKSVNGGMVKVQAIDNVLKALQREGFSLPGDVLEIKGKLDKA